MATPHMMHSAFLEVLAMYFWDATDHALAADPTQSNIQ